MRASDALRSGVPQSVRERLYALHPGRGRRWRRFPGLECVGPTGRAVLTFDDGPDEEGTLAILDRLDEAEAQATFFVLGSQVQAAPDLAREIVLRGHELGLHGFHHERQDRMDPQRAAHDVCSGFAAVEEHTGVRCEWYRPPYGKMSAGGWEACTELDMAVVYWCSWGLDWEEVPPGRITDVVCESLREGAIILLHDSARYARRSTAMTTASAIPDIAERARVAGLRLTSVGDATAAARAAIV